MGGLACALLAGGCAHSESAEERQMAQMREEITRVQADRDRFEQRANALELQAADAHHPLRIAPSGLARIAAPRDSVPTPKLRVIRLSPDGSEETSTSAETAGDGGGTPSAEDPDDNAPRPAIRIRGVAGPGGARGRASDEHIEQTLPDEPTVTGTTPTLRDNGPPVTKSSALDPEAQRAYDQALSLVNTHQYSQALDAFAAFLVKYPDHPNADNATFWRGECYFAQQDYLRAAEQFEGVIARFPLGNKVPDALLKLGMTQQKLGNAQKANGYYDKLLREYPRSEAAHRIPEKS